MSSSDKPYSARKRISHNIHKHTAHTGSINRRIRFCTNARNTVYDVFRCRGWKDCSPISSNTTDDTSVSASSASSSIIFSSTASLNNSNISNSGSSSNSSSNSFDINMNSEWDIIWADREWMREIFDSIHLQTYQKVNHFRNHNELTRKDLMAKNIKRMKRKLMKSGKISKANEFNFIPQTYCLPLEYAIFVEEFKKQQKQITSPNSSISSNSSIRWIMKPVGKCQGKGIFLFNRLSDIKDWKKSMNHYNINDEQSSVIIPESYIVQKYISNPLLIGYKKFDLRIYVLVTNYSPMTVYIYRSGFARFSISKYCNSISNLDNSFMHLTNAAIQKNADEYCRENDLKWNLRSLKLYFVNKFGEKKCNQMFEHMQKVIIQSLLSVQHLIINDKHCFELYGYDIMIDDSLKVWLIEVNAAPSLSSSSDEDYLLKFALINDCMDIVMEQKSDQNILQSGGFDMCYKQQCVEYHQRCCITSYLGCENPSLAKYKPIVDKFKKRKNVNK